MDSAICTCVFSTLTRFGELFAEGCEVGKEHEEDPEGTGWERGVWIGSKYIVCICKIHNEEIKVIFLNIAILQPYQRQKFFYIHFTNSLYFK